MGVRRGFLWDGLGVGFFFSFGSSSCLDLICVVFPLRIPHIFFLFPMVQTIYFYSLAECLYCWIMFIISVHFSFFLITALLLVSVAPRFLFTGSGWDGWGEGYKVLLVWGSC